MTVILHDNVQYSATSRESEISNLCHQENRVKEVTRHQS